MEDSEKGESTPVIVLMSAHAGFEDWDWTSEHSYIARSDLYNVRYFIVSEETKYMSEVALHPAVPNFFESRQNQNQDNFVLRTFVQTA